MSVAFPAGVIKASSLEQQKPDYIQEVKAKADAKVLIACGKTPLLTRGQYGSGIVYCVAATPIGAHNVWDGPEWQDVMGVILGDLGLKRAAP
jgi:hypothetical protein